MSWGGGAGWPAPPAPPGDPPPPGGPDPPPPPGGPDPPPPGGSDPEGPPGYGFGGSYFFMAFPKALITRCSCVGAGVVNPTVSVGALVPPFSGLSSSDPCPGCNISFCHS